MNRIWTGISAFAAGLFRVLRDRRGSGAIEFAIIAPILIVTYLGAFEISLGFTVSRKVSSASGTIADLVAQQPTVDAAFLDSMNTVAKSIIAPYGSEGYTLKISGIRVTSAGKGTLVWSRNQMGGRPYVVNSITTVPADISAVGNFVVRAELVVPHKLMLFAPGMSDSTLKTIKLSRTYYFRQRVGEQISCSNC